MCKLSIIKLNNYFLIKLIIPALYIFLFSDSYRIRVNRLSLHVYILLSNRYICIQNVNKINFISKTTFE